MRAQGGNKPCSCPHSATHPAYLAASVAQAIVPLQAMAYMVAWKDWEAFDQYHEQTGAQLDPVLVKKGRQHELEKL